MAYRLMFLGILGISILSAVEGGLTSVLITSGDNNISDKASRRTWISIKTPNDAFDVSSPGVISSFYNVNPSFTYTPELYYHAAIYRSVTTYSIKVPAGRYWVRLLFAAFLDVQQGVDARSAKFSVVAGVTPTRNVTLLEKFTPFVSSTDSSTPSLKEFSVQIPAGHSGLMLYFVPELGSFAYVNSLEVTGWQSALYGSAIQDNVAVETVGRINCGGELLEPSSKKGSSDKTFRTWESDLANDPAYSTPSYSATINGTGLAPFYLVQPVFQSMRAVAQNSMHYYFGVDYNLSTSSGWTYLVRLHFAEIVPATAGSRIMDVYINERIVLKKLDIFNEVGFANALAKDILFYLPRNESSISLSIRANAESPTANPQISGIEVLKLGMGAAGLSDNLQGSPSSQTAVALRAIAAATNYSGAAAWTGPDPCLPKQIWANVYCTNASVIGLVLNDAGLQGTIPSDALLNLTSLQYLYLRNNNLQGPLPAAIINLKNLIKLYLDNNSFTGELPAGLADLVNLEELFVQRNKFTGAVPAGLLSSTVLNNFTFHPGNSGLCSSVPSNKFSLSRCKASGSSKLSAETIGIIAGGSSLLLLVLICSGVISYCCFFRKKRSLRGSARDLPFATLTNESKKSLLTSTTSSPSASGKQKIQVAGADRVFTLKDLRKATDNFSERTILGRGAFGNVYYGQLPSGELVAIKRRDAGAPPEDLDALRHEMFFISKIRHKDLVCLQGYCVERARPNNPAEFLLVYEYMENKTLRYWLVEGNQSLAWSERLKVVVGAARGLRYLHTGHQPPLIHRDVKTTNIFLDKSYNGRLADFCISRGPRELDPYSSFGGSANSAFLDPEYFQRKRLTDKSDVYSFGVVLLEVVTGQPNLVEYAKPKLKDSSFVDLVDRTMRGRFNPQSVNLVAELTLSCLQEKGKDRPSMDHVLRTLISALRLEEGEAYQGPPTQSERSPGSGVLSRIASSSRLQPSA